MKKTRLRSSVALLLVGFVLGFFSSYLIFGCDKSSQKVTATIEKSKVLKQEAKTIGVSYQKQISVLQNQNIELQQQLEVTQGLLQQAKQEAKEKENKIKEFLLPARPFPNFYRTKPLENYVALFSNKERSISDNCDSLKKEVVGYIEANHRKDSVYESQILLFDSVIANKDLAIEASQNAYSDLKLLFDKSLSAQSTLQKENLSFRKESKRQKFKSKVLTGALLVVSGFAANLLLH